MKYLSEIARIQSDDDKQTARNKVSSARTTLAAAIEAYKTATSDVGSKKRGSASRQRAAKYLRDALNARRTVRRNANRALQPKTEET